MLSLCEAQKATLAILSLPTRAELTGQVIRLGRLVTELRPEPEVIGLLTLMLLHESRRAARTSPSGFVEFWSGHSTIS
jgi:predicted RNA polymerase sigma factor